MTPAKMFDGDLWVLASDVMRLAENAYKNGQTDEREACATECERMMMYPNAKQEAAAHDNVWAAAKAIRARGKTE